MQRKQWNENEYMNVYKYNNCPFVCVSELSLTVRGFTLPKLLTLIVLQDRLYACY
jgi:hypothetical protein